MSVYADWQGGQAMRRRRDPGFLLVATRELRWMRRDRLALFLAIGVPIIAFTVLALIFSNAVIRNLRVSIVDADRSATSLIYVQAIASAPGVSVAQRSGDMTSAMHAVRSGDAIAAIYIPENFERDLIARQTPEDRRLSTTANISPPATAPSAAISNAIAAATAALLATSAANGDLRAGLAGRRAIRAHQSGAELRAIPAARHSADGPARHHRDCGRICGRLGVLAAQPAEPGSEPPAAARSPRSSASWRRFSAIFMLMMVVDAGIIHGVFAVPFRGDSLLMGAAACLLVIAYLSLGSLLQLLVRNLALGHEPHRHFLQSRPSASPASVFRAGDERFRALLGRAAAAALVYSDPVRSGRARPCRRRISVAAVHHPRRARPRCSSRSPGCGCEASPDVARIAEPAPIEACRSRARHRRRDGRRIASHRQRPGVFGLIVLAPIIYGLLYPQPYLGQLLRDLPIAVVDQDHTELSRDLIQTLNADEAVDGRASAPIPWPRRRRRWRGGKCLRSSTFPRTPSGRC